MERTMRDSSKKIKVIKWLVGITIVCGLVVFHCVMVIGGNVVGI